MKLPRIGYTTGMRRLETVDPRLVVGEANERAIAFSALAGAAAGIGDIAAREGEIYKREQAALEKAAIKQQKEYNDRQIKLQETKALGDYLLGSQRASAQYAGMVKIPGNMIPQEVQTRLGKQIPGNAQVSRHEVWPEIQYHLNMQALRQTSEQIADLNARELFVAKQTQKIMDAYGQDIQDAVTAQRVESRRQTQEYTDELVRNKQYQSAIEIIASSDLPAKEKDKLTDSVIATRQTQQIVDAISMADDDPNKEPTLDMLIGKIQQDDMQFTSHIQPRKATLLSNLQSAKTKLAAASAQQMRMSWKVTKDNINTALSNVENHGSPLPEDFDKWYSEAAMKVQTEQDPEALLLLKKMDEARQISGILPAIMNADPQNRENLALNLINNITTEDVHKEAYYRNVIEPKLANAQRAYRSDPVKYLQKWNGRAKTIPGPDFQNPESLTEYTIRMLPFEKQISEQTGKEGVIFTNAQYDELNQVLGSKVVGAEQKYQIIESIISALPTDRQKYGFVNTLGDQGAAASMVVGAQLIGGEHQAAALSIIRGFDYSQDEAKRITKDVSNDITDRYAEDLGAFMITSPYQAQYMEAVESVYHDLLVSSHGDRTKFDSSLYEQAVDTVTGGPLIELSDRKLYPFRRGQDTSQAKDMLKDVHPDTYQGIELQKGVTYAQILKNVAKGEWKLNAIAPNQYFVEVENGYTMTRIKDVVGADYVFSIPENYESKKARKYFLDLPPGAYPSDITTLQGMEEEKKRRREEKYRAETAERGEVLRGRVGELQEVESFVQQVSGKEGL